MATALAPRKPRRLDAPECEQVRYDGPSRRSRDHQPVKALVAGRGADEARSRPVLLANRVADSAVAQGSARSPWNAARTARARPASTSMHAPANLPDGVPTMPLPAPPAGHQANYIIGGTRKTLLTLVNYGCVAMHVMNSRTDHLDRPDWLAFDLDPADGFESAARAGLLLRDRLADHGLESFPKTSGGRGLHVFVPLRRGAAQDQVQAYAAAIARELATAYPTVISVEPRKARRRAPVYRRHHAQRVRTDNRAAFRSSVAVSRPRLDASQLGRGQPAPQPRHLQHPHRGTPHGPQVTVVQILRPPSDAAANLVQGSGFRVQGSGSTFRVHSSAFTKATQVPVSSLNPEP